MTLASIGEHFHWSHAVAFGLIILAIFFAFLKTDETIRFAVRHIMVLHGQHTPYTQSAQDGYRNVPNTAPPCFLFLFQKNIKKVVWYDNIYYLCRTENKCRTTCKLLIIKA